MEHMWKSVGVLFLVLGIAAGDADLPDLESNSMGSREYCNRDVFFEPRCDASEVILLSSAAYGRMRNSRCITDNLGSIGCAADALSFLDSQCSGRRSCQVIIPQIDQHITSTCPRGWEKYLEVTYDCIKVAYPPRGYCEPNGPTDIGNHRGYLSNLVTKETGCGSTNSPWRITALPGQKFRIHLWNFNYASHDASLDNCDLYVLSTDVKQSVSHTICAGVTRESSTYTSLTNEVELRLETVGHEENQDSYFIVEYEAFGCTNKEPPEYGWIQRIEDHLRIGCNSTSEHVHQWELKCNGTHWIGEEKECLPMHITSTQIILPEQSRTQQPTNRPRSIGIESTMSILVIAGLAVLVCLCIVLSCMAVYIVRFRRRERSLPDQDTDCDYNSHNRRPQVANRHSLTTRETEGWNSIETDDYWTWQKSQRGPLRNNVADDSRTLPGTIASRTSHQNRLPEESTLLVRKPEDERKGFSSARKAADYDKLDPNFREDSSIIETAKRDYTS